MSRHLSQTECSALPRHPLAFRVEIETHQYESSHGKSPKGRGSWAFCPSIAYPRGNYLENVVFFPGSLLYRDASGYARNYFAARGVDSIVACP